MMDKITLSKDFVATFGGVNAIRDRVTAFIQAKQQHRFTINEPAPVEHGLIEAIAARGGWDEVVEIIASPPPSEPEVPEQTASPPPPATAEDLILQLPFAQALLLGAATIDGQAEQLRMALLSGGTGQTMEYLRTEQEARAWRPGQSLDSYPMLLAEALAVKDVTGAMPAPAEVVASVLASAEAWATTGAAIKRERRARKMRLAAATTAQEIRAIVVAPWPGEE